MTSSSLWSKLADVKGIHQISSFHCPNSSVNLVNCSQLNRWGQCFCRDLISGPVHPANVQGSCGPSLRYVFKFHQQYPFWYDILALVSPLLMKITLHQSASFLPDVNWNRSYVEFCAEFFPFIIIFS